MEHFQLIYFNILALFVITESIGSKRTDVLHGNAKSFLGINMVKT